MTTDSLSVSDIDSVTPKRSGLTVLVPAYNEADYVADTIRSIQSQTVPPEEIIVIDDCSSDNTGDVARALGVTVLRPPTNTGTKAGAQNYAMPFVRTEFTMAVDADTVLAPDGIEKILTGLDDKEVVAACGFVLPKHVGTMWERGRYVEYLFAFTFYKPIQDFYTKPLISSGCFSVYRTDVLRTAGGWSNQTMAEDMDLTWRFYMAGHAVRFVPDAVCYPVEPSTQRLMGKQLKRWSHGFIQNVRLHWRGLLGIPFLRNIILVGLWDATIGSVAYLIVLPILAILAHPIFLLAYLIDFGAVAVPTLVKAHARGETLRALASLPSFFVLRAVNGFYMLRAIWNEVVLRKTLLVYEKGH